MKAEIHPDYQDATIVCLSCNSETPTRSTQASIRVDICSNCHPHYTGKKRIVDTAGRVDRFNQRRVASEKAQKAAAKREKAKANS
ncbi:MAG TPA: 50S ribosomal protein L31 [Abditibacteriaceae bacterium]